MNTRKSPDTHFSSAAHCILEIRDMPSIEEYVNNSPASIISLYSGHYGHTYSPVKSVQLSAIESSYEPIPSFQFDIAHVDIKKKDIGAAIRHMSAAALEASYDIHEEENGAIRIDIDGVEVHVSRDELLARLLVETESRDSDHRRAIGALGTVTTLTIDALYSVATSRKNDDRQPNDDNVNQLSQPINIVVSRETFADESISEVEVETPSKELVPVWHYEEGGSAEFSIKSGFTSLGGLHAVKERLEENIICLRQPDVAKIYDVAFSHILLHGPPGTGKTSIAHAYADELGAALTELRASDIIDKFVGNSSKQVRDKFEKIKSKNEPHVVFLDEIEALANLRSNDSSERTNALKELMMQISDISKNHPNIAIIAASNADMDDLDPALIRSGRLKPISVPLPSERDRAEIWGISMTPTLPSDLSDDIKTGFNPYEYDIDIQVLAQQSDGMTGADIVTILGEARKKKMYTAARTKFFGRVSQQDLLDEIKNLHRR